jgi:hypothetical protein
MNGMNNDCPPLYGKYRGVVTDNKDPNGLGRIQVKVLDVAGGENISWAMPCVPYAGKGVGLYLIPPQDASVWIEFEHGDPDYPIWSGCFWAEGEVPVTSSKNEITPEKKVLKTVVATITLNDSVSDGGVAIETNQDPKIKIVINKDGIEITNGQGASIKLSGPTVKINDQALEVT